MFQSLKFVQGAVSKKGFTPELSHFKIENGFVQSYNGVIALCSPLPFDIDCIPKAEPFIKAIRNCDETVVLGMTKANRLSIRSGNFKAFIECLDIDTTRDAHVGPEGTLHNVNGEQLVEALTAISPFIGKDASRPWSTGVLIKDQSAYATNNVIFAEYWLGFSLPRPCNIPRQAVAELVRIKEPPVQMQLGEKSLSFHYSDGRWIRCQLLDNGWPDPEPLFAATRENETVKLEEDFFAALAAVKPFTDDFGRLYFTGDSVNTGRIKEQGASYALDYEIEGVYQCDMLELLEDTANQIDFSFYPKPCPFFGEKLRGIIIGMRADAS